MPTPEDWKWLEEVESVLDDEEDEIRLAKKLRSAWEREEKLEKALDFFRKWQNDKCPVCDGWKTVHDGFIAPDESRRKPCRACNKTGTFEGWLKHALAGEKTGR